MCTNVNVDVTETCFLVVFEKIIPTEGRLNAVVHDENWSKNVNTQKRDMCKKCQKCVKWSKTRFCTKMTKKSWKKSFAKLGLVKMCVTFVTTLWPFLTHLWVMCNHRNRVLGSPREKYILFFLLKMCQKTVLQKWSHLWHKMHTNCTHLENAQENELPWVCKFPKSGSFCHLGGPKTGKYVFWKFLYRKRGYPFFDMYPKTWFRGDTHVTQNVH